MSNDHTHEQPQRFRFTFKRRGRRAVVFENIVGSGFGPGGGFYMLTTEDGVTVGVPTKGRRILIEPM